MVKFEDRDKNVECFHIALKIVGMFDDYQTTDLIYQIYKTVNEKGNNATLYDILKTKTDWEDKWKKYEEKD